MNDQAMPLTGIRILDLTRILAGPWATQIMADLGAEVIKVERPVTGDDTRAWGPPDIVDSAGRTRGSAYFNSANRGKRSVAVDFSRPEGQDLIKRLAARSDVVVENFKFGGLVRLGLDYPSLQKLNPKIVYCSITGFGQTGPYAQRAGYDFLIQAMGGLMSVTGMPDGAPGQGPMKVGVALTDVLTGLYAVIAIQAALRHRDNTGKGQHIDLSLLDVEVATLANQALNFLATGNAPGRLGNAHPNIVPYQSFAVSDGHIILAVGNDRQFARFCKVAGCPEIACDERYSTNPARVKNREMLIPILEKIMIDRPLADWVEKLDQEGVPAGPINTLDQVFSDPQVRSRGMETRPRTADAAEVPGVASPIKFSQTPAQDLVASPLLGENTQAVLREVLNLSEQEIDALLAQGIIGAHSGQDHA